MKENSDLVGLVAYCFFRIFTVALERLLKVRLGQVRANEKRRKKEKSYYENTPPSRRGPKILLCFSVIIIDSSAESLLGCRITPSAYGTVHNHS